MFSSPRLFAIHFFVMLHAHAFADDAGEAETLLQKLDADNGIVQHDEPPDEVPMDEVPMDGEDLEENMFAVDDFGNEDEDPFTVINITADPYLFENGVETIGTAVAISVSGCGYAVGTLFDFIIPESAGAHAAAGYVEAEGTAVGSEIHVNGCLPVTHGSIRGIPTGSTALLLQTQNGAKASVWGMMFVGFQLGTRAGEWFARERLMFGDNGKSLWWYLNGQHKGPSMSYLPARRRGTSDVRRRADKPGLPEWESNAKKEEEEKAAEMAEANRRMYAEEAKKAKAKQAAYQAKRAKEQAAHNQRMATDSAYKARYNYGYRTETLPNGRVVARGYGGRGHR